MKEEEKEAQIVLLDCINMVNKAIKKIEQKHISCKNSVLFW